MSRYKDIQKLLDYLFGDLFVGAVPADCEINSPHTVVTSPEGLQDFLKKYGIYILQTNLHSIKRLSLDGDDVLIERCTILNKRSKDNIVVKWTEEEKASLQEVFEGYVIYCPPLDLTSVRVSKKGDKSIYGLSHLDMSKAKPLDPPQLRRSKLPMRPPPSPPWI